MNNLPKREWAGFAVAIVLVVGSLGYAVSISSDALSSLGAYRSRTDDLSTNVNRVAQVVIAADEAERIDTQLTNLRDRFNDAKKQGRIVSQLSEFARDSSLKVLEIQPTRPTGAGAAPYPLYRVSVQGGYEQLASYLHGLKSLRVPARAVGFGMWPASDGNAVARGDLTADITVEAFIHQESEQEAGDG